MSNIKTIRERLRMTQAALAVSVGVTQSAIAHYENERRKPGLDECRKIVSAFNTHGADVTLDEVFPPAAALSAA